MTMDCLWTTRAFDTDVTNDSDFVEPISDAPEVVPVTIAPLPSLGVNCGYGYNRFF